MKQSVILLCIAIIVLFVIVSIKPISFSDNNERISGKVINIYEGGIKDIVFELENNESTYYINRGLETKFNLEKLKTEIIGKEVSINYAVGWTPLDPLNNRSKEISELKFGDIIIYKN